MQHENKWLKRILFSLPFIYGLFYEFSACLTGLVLSVYLIGLLRERGGRLIFIKDKRFLCLTVLIALYGVTSFWAVDRGMAFLAFIKMIPCLLFAIVLMQFDRETIRDCYDIIPLSGAVMVALTGPGILIPGWMAWAFDGGRLGGFFQYANTFAIFLLIGFIIAGFSTKKLK